MIRDLKAFIDIMVTGDAATQINKLRSAIQGMTGELVKLGNAAKVAQGKIEQSARRPLTYWENLRRQLLQMRFLMLDVARNLQYTAFRAGIALAGIVTGMTKIGKAAVDAQSHWEQATLTFGALLGSMSKARGLMKDLQTFALRSPFDLRQTVDATKVLLAYGFAVDDVRGKVGDLFDTITKQAFVFDKPLEQVAAQLVRMREGTYRVREAAAAGFTKDLLQSYGVPWDEGRQRPAVFGQELVDLIWKGMRERYKNIDYGEMTRILLSNIQDAMYKAFRNLGQSIEPIVKPILAMVMDLVNGISDAFSDPGIAATIRNFADNVIGGPLRHLIDVIRGLTERIKDDPDVLGRFLRSFASGLSALASVLATSLIFGLIANFAHAIGSLTALIIGGGPGGVLAAGGLIAGIIALGAAFVKLKDMISGVMGPAETIQERIAKLNEKLQLLKERRDELKEAGGDDPINSKLIADLADEELRVINDLINAYEELQGLRGAGQFLADVGGRFGAGPKTGPIQNIVDKVSKEQEQLKDWNLYVGYGQWLRGMGMNLDRFSSPGVTGAAARDEVRSRFDIPRTMFVTGGVGELDNYLMGRAWYEQHYVPMLDKELGDKISNLKARRVGLSAAAGTQAGVGEMIEYLRSSLPDVLWPSGEFDTSKLIGRFDPTGKLFGRVHHGIDIPGAMGDPIFSPLAGTIGDRFGFDKKGGNRLWVNVPGLGNIYMAHLMGYADGIGPGAQVAKGQLLGYVGDTGNAKGTTPHIHLEFHPNGGAAVDPLTTLFNPEGYSITDVTKLYGDELATFTEIGKSMIPVQEKLDGLPLALQQVRDKFDNISSLMGDFGSGFEDINDVQKHYRDALADIARQAMEAGPDVFAGLDGWQEVLGAWRDQMAETISQMAIESERAGWWARYGYLDTEARYEQAKLYGAAARGGNIHSADMSAAYVPLEYARRGIDDALRRAEYETDAGELAKLEEQILEKLDMLRGAIDEFAEKAPDVSRFAEYNYGQLQQQYEQSGLHERVRDNVTALQANTQALYDLIGALGSFVSGIASAIAGALDRAMAGGAYTEGGSGDEILGPGGVDATGRVPRGDYGGDAGGYEPGKTRLIPKREGGVGDRTGITPGAMTYNNGERGWWSMEDDCSDGT